MDGAGAASADFCNPPKRRGQQQHDEFSRFHAASLRKVAAFFNQTLPPAKVLVCRTTALARTPASH